VATLARQLAQGKKPDHPVLGGPGWWQREVRLLYPPHGEVHVRSACGRVLLISGATGTLGQAFARMCTLRGLPHRLLGRADLDIADARGVESALARWQPWAVVNAAGYVRVDDAEHAPEQWRENALGPAVLAKACARHGVRLLTFSSDLVFDGDKALPYIESDVPRPLNAYGRGKLEAERRVLEHDPKALVIRTSAFFGPWDSFNFITLALEAIGRGERWRAPHDQFVSPTYVPDLVQSSLDLLIDDESGVWHLANRGAVSWAVFAQLAVDAARLDVALVEGLPGAALGQVARRPRFSALDSERGVLMPSLHDGIRRYVAATRERATLALSAA
jgi:dTDP-4-dehydrorhamnose reductase